MNFSLIKKGFIFIKQGLFPNEDSYSETNTLISPENLPHLIPNKITSSLQFKEKIYSPTPLFSSSEFNFYLKLKSILNPYFDVLFEVPYSAFIKLNPHIHLSDKDRHFKFQEFANKRADFVVIDNKGSIFCIIELDDPTHLSSSAKQFDSFKENILHCANIPLVRIQNTQHLSHQQLFPLLFSIQK